jgi:hypothetical protein
MDHTSLKLTEKVIENLETRIDKILFTMTGFVVFVDAAHRTDSLAIFTTKDLAWQIQGDFLEEKIIQFKYRSFEKDTIFGIGLRITKTLIHPHVQNIGRRFQTAGTGIDEFPFNSHHQISIRASQDHSTVGVDLSGFQDT